MNTITAAQAGVRNADLQAFLNRLKNAGLNMHSVVMARNGSRFFECYWEPFNQNTPHRMYSVTKSFVSVAIGCLAEEGKLSLDDPIIQYFPDKLPPVVPEELQNQTIRDMLMMSTCFAGQGWFKPEITDRLAWYFAQKPVRPAGTLFDYDSTGSYVMGELVERLSGMKLMEYLHHRVFRFIGGFENAEMLQVPDGGPWADSALLCTPRDLLTFAQFVMQRGQWNGKQLMDAEYLKQATSLQTTNDLQNCFHYNTLGYGYQFWMNLNGSFSFNGMGGQFAVCVPQKNFVFVCTGDNQLNSKDLFPILFDSLFDCIVSRLADEELPEEAPFVPEGLALPVTPGLATCPMADEMAGKWYVCKENPMQISRFRFDFSSNEGVFTYVNAQGEKQLPFGLGKNVFGPFPQAGYSDQRGNVHEINDFRYRCCASGAWVDANKLQINVQIIDRYFGQLAMNFGFRGKDAGVKMVKSAEDFLNEYQGWISASQE